MNEKGAFNWFTPSRFGVLLALFIFAAFPQVVLGLQTFVIRDFGFFAYPLASFQRECFWHGELPFWDPYNECGVPFLAQWNTMSLYPPALLYLLLPLHWSLGVFSLLHLWFAGMGMYLLARRWAGNDFAAAFAGTVFAFNGLTLNLLMWPSHIATISWMPWVVLLVESTWRDGSRKFFLAALAGAMQMLAGGPETIFLTWLILAALWIRHLIKGTDSCSGTFWSFPAVVLLVAALASAQLLPFLDLAAHSQRNTGYADLRWSMPGSGWVNFLVPMAFGDTRNNGVFFQHGQLWTSSYYFGIAAVSLAMIAAACVRRAPIRLLTTFAIIAVIFALGENTFVYPTLRKLIPALGLVTYPIKFTLLLTFAIPLLSAFALAEVQKKNLARSLGFSTLVLLALMGAILFWEFRYPIGGDDVHITLLNALARALFLLFANYLLISITRARALPSFAPVLLVAATWLDVWTHEPTQNPTASPSIYAPDVVREKLNLTPSPAPGTVRVMTTPTALSRFVHTAIRQPEQNFLVARLGCQADCNLLDHIPKVDGFFSLTPREWSDVRELLYDRPDDSLTGLEDFLGVSQITATNDIFQWQSRRTFLPLVTAGQTPVVLDDSNILAALSNPAFNGNKIVYLPVATADLSSLHRDGPAAVSNIHFGNNRINFNVATAEPTMVVIAQAYSDHWHVFVDGHRTTLLRADHAFQALSVPGGLHQVVLIYQDRVFAIGLTISAAAFLVCGAGLFLARRKTSRNVQTSSRQFFSSDLK